MSIFYRALLIALVSVRSPTFGDDHVHVDRSDSGMVVSDSALASRIGRNILMQGGNAVDAAVATAFALAVTWPEAGNLGGGGFMIVRPADGKDPVCVDYRETAPGSMNRNSFTRDDGTHSQKAVGVPGTVRGLAAAHARFGQLPWRDVVAPAARLAKGGFQVTAPLARSVNGVLNIGDVKSDSKFDELRRVYGKPDGTPWQAGDRMVLPDLAATLTEIAGDPAAFYTGRLADLLVAEMQRGDGLISHEDLLGYRARIRPALRGTFRGFTVIGAPPPSSGGTCVIEALNILENFDLAGRDRFDQRNVHLIAETCRRVFADRARFLGDPEFTRIPPHLITKEYAKKIAASIDLAAATKSEAVAPEIELATESPDTTHFSVIDSDGMAVSNTYTLEGVWGSRIVVRGAGYTLNNEMGDFNWFPGETNRVGRIGTDANLVAGGKRMLSSMSPTIVEKDGKVLLITGSPGGRTIINTVLCIVLNFTEFGMDVASAVTAPRQHHQWFPDRLDLEDLADEPHSIIADSLRRAGHGLGSRTTQGSAHTIGIDHATGTVIGVADYRRSGRPAAVSTDTLAVWDFSDAAAKGLKATANAGKLQARWSADIAGCMSNGKDQFIIQRDAPDEPLDSYLPLGTQAASSGRIVVTVKVDAAHFSGERQNEQLRFGFTDDDNNTPRVTARMIFGRDGQGNIVVRGEALGGGSEVPATTLAQGDRLRTPIVLRLTVDVDTDRYAIASRTADSLQFTEHGTAKIAADRSTRFLRLSVLNDFAADGEFVAIGRIELRRP
ncbi:MAG: gamma-glutamyltransferase [Fuerstiella sp.]|nr:gamma-glutamyltransferase [Fuerstiella sp.]MCP4855442.1 gamma-glutamyltransferase [Fuerstiella sp.]